MEMILLLTILDKIPNAPNTPEKQEHQQKHKLSQEVTAWFVLFAATVANKLGVVVQVKASVFAFPAAFWREMRSAFEGRLDFRQDDIQDFLRLAGRG